MKILYNNNLTENQKKLTIIIPQFNENDYCIKPLLDSLAMQISINFNDFEIIIVNDGSTTLLSNNLLDNYNFPIVYVQNEHGGPSVARNVGLELSTADYVMFCDADDRFISILGLNTIFNKIAEFSYDLINSSFLEECCFSDGTFANYYLHTQDKNYVHGKVYNRKFLIGNNIKWRNDLTVHEDVYFNGVAIAMAKESCYVEEPFYLWCWNKQSVTRMSSDNSFTFKTFDQVMYSSDCLVTELVNRNLYITAMVQTVLVIYQAFHVLTGVYSEDTKNADKIKQYTAQSASFYKKFKYLWNALDSENKKTVMNNSANYAKQQGFYKQTITIDNWLAQLNTIN